MLKIFNKIIVIVSLLFASAGALAVCPVGGSEHVFGTDLGCIHELTQSESHRFMKLLERAGIQPDDPAVMGVVTLNVDRIDCSKIVIPNATPHCTLSKEDKLIDIEDSDAAYAFRKLYNKYRASLYEPGCIMGSINVEAYDLVCSKGVFPYAVPACDIVTPVTAACPED